MGSKAIFDRLAGALEPRNEKVESALRNHRFFRGGHCCEARGFDRPGPRTQTLEARRGAVSVSSASFSSGTSGRLWMLVRRRHFAWRRISGFSSVKRRSKL